MNYLTFLCCLFFFFVCIFYAKNKPLHPATLFYGLYSFILFLSLLNLFHIYKPSDKAYFLILIMLCSFGIGTISGNVFPLVKFCYGNKGNKKKQHQLNFKLFYFFIGIYIVISLYDIFVIYQLLRSGVSLWQIRNWTLEEFGTNNPILARRSFLEEIFRTVIMAPIIMLIPPIAAYSFFSPEYAKKRKSILIFSIVYLLLRSVTGGGGRLGFVYFSGCFIISYLMFSDRKKYTGFRKGKYKKYIIVFISLAIFCVIFATRMRLGAGFLFQQIYTYFALPPTLLSIWLPKIEDSNYTCGILSFYGLFGYPFRALKMLGLDFLVPSLYDEAFQHILNAQKFMDTGYGIGNAFVTPVYYLMIDGGKRFLCIVSIALGILTSRIHKKMLKKKADIQEFTIYALMMNGVFCSFMTIMTAVPANVLSIIYVLVMFKKRAHNTE